MAGAFRGRAGGIAGLLALPAEQWQAIEVDLLSKGFVLADIPDRVTWRALIGMLAYADRESACFIQQVTEDTPWSAEMQLQAFIVDQLQAVTFRLDQFMWVYGSAHGQKGRPQPQPPKPLPRPGLKASLPAGTKHMGSDPIPASDFAAFWSDPAGYDGEEEAA